MRPLQLLFDEHVTSRLDSSLRRESPTTRLFRVGREPAPPIGTPDPQLLLWAEEHHCIFVTLDHASLPTHFGEHIAAGHTCHGVVILDRVGSIGQWLDGLRTILGASSALDWINRIEYLPL